MKKQIVECKSLGIPLTESVARYVDSVCKTIPQAQRHIVRKASVGSTDLVSGEKADVSWITTDDVDREGDIVLPDGIDLTQFVKNPVVTFAHKYDEMPVGKAQWVRRVGNGFKAKTVYATKPADWTGDWFPDSVYALVQQEILKGKSVGFVPTFIRSPTSQEIERRPEYKSANAVIQECILLEYAVCSVPVNQASLTTAVAKGVIRDPRLMQALGLAQTVKAKAVQPEVDDEAALLELVLERLAHLELDPAKIAKRAIDKHRGSLSV